MFPVSSVFSFGIIGVFSETMAPMVKFQASQNQTVSALKGRVDRPWVTQLPLPNLSFCNCPLRDSTGLIGEQDTLGNKQKDTGGVKNFQTF